MLDVLSMVELLSLQHLFVVLLVLFFVTILSYLVYSGLWTPITVTTSEPDYGPLTIAYRTGTGPYKDASDIFTESFCLLPHREQIGIYYDDPEGVPSQELRYAVGPILASGEQKADPEEMEKMRNEGFKIVHLPRPSYVVNAIFPFTTTLSIYLGIYRVYPRLRDYIAERSLCAYPAIEIYSDSKIVFMMPLSKQEEFFVAEFQDDQISVATTVVESSQVEEDSFGRPRTPPATENDTDRDVTENEDELTDYSNILSPQ